GACGNEDDWIGRGAKQLGQQIGQGRDALHVPDPAAGAIGAALPKGLWVEPNHLITKPAGLVAVVVGSGDVEVAAGPQLHALERIDHRDRGATGVAMQDDVAILARSDRQRGGLVVMRRAVAAPVVSRFLTIEGSGDLRGGHGRPPETIGSGDDLNNANGDNSLRIASSPAWSLCD